MITQTRDFVKRFFARNTQIACGKRVSKSQLTCVKVSIGERARVKCVSIAFQSTKNHMRYTRLLRVNDHCLTTFSELKNTRNAFIFSIGCDVAAQHKQCSTSRFFEISTLTSV